MLLIYVLQKITFPKIFYEREFRGPHIIWSVRRIQFRSSRCHHVLADRELKITLVG
jgi:hypothetical protein